MKKIILIFLTVFNLLIFNSEFIVFADDNEQNSINVVEELEDSINEYKVLYSSTTN